MSNESWISLIRDMLRRSDRISESPQKYIWMQKMFLILQLWKGTSQVTNQIKPLVFKLTPPPPKMVKTSWS